MEEIFVFILFHMQVLHEVAGWDAVARGTQEGVTGWEPGLDGSLIYAGTIVNCSFKLCRKIRTDTRKSQYYII